MGCGLCCDGTVLSHLAVSDLSDLGAPLIALGVELIAVADPPAFPLPCPAVDEGVCTVFDLHRPHACEQFECDLLGDVHAGRISEVDARAVIGATIALRDRVRAGQVDDSALAARVAQHFRRP